MPSIGWFEIFIIATVAIIVVGPKDFPIMLKKMGSWFGSIKKYISNVQNQVSELDDVIIDDDTKINQNQNSNKDEDKQKK